MSSALHQDERGPWPPVQKGQSLPGAGIFAMRIFLASLAMPFLACIIGYLNVRAWPEGGWPPPGAPPLPYTALWVSTGLILSCSLCIQWSLRAVREDQRGSLLVSLSLVSLLGIGFMVSQCFAWAPLLDTHEIAGLQHYVFTFYMLTGLHALHVVAGLGLHAWVTTRAFLGHYWSLYHPGVHYNALYWHFLDVAWLALFAVLVLGS